MTIHGAPTIDTPPIDEVRRTYDAVLVLSFGGPEGPEEVRPFLEYVLAGRPVPPERIDEVAEHYLHFGGVSPLNAQNRALVQALGTELSAHGPDIPIYLGNRNWHPFVADTIRAMWADGVERAAVFVTSAFACYSGCRQYREDIIRAQAEIGGEGPVFDKLRLFYNHPGFIEPCAENVRRVLEGVPAERRAAAHVVFTAHSIPEAMARHSRYEAQLQEASRLVADGAGVSEHTLAYQSRSGSPRIPWLGPDILDYLPVLARRGVQDVMVMPIGFISDHMEVMFDLDVEAAAAARDLGLNFARAATVGITPPFVRMIRELILERTQPDFPRRAVGAHGPSHDLCPPDCCRRGSG